MSNEQGIKTVQERYDTALLKGYNVLPHKINRNKSKDPDKWTITNYKDGDLINFLNYNGTYCQIIKDLNAKDYLEDVETNKDNCSYFVIAASNDWGSETLKDGYDAQFRAREIIENENIKDIIVIVDRNAAIGKKIDKTPLYYNSFFFNPNLIGQLINDVFKRDIMQFNLANADFLPFGCDKYGQVLGNVYVKISTKNGDSWINLSKYILSGTKLTSTGNDFYNAELNEI